MNDRFIEIKKQIGKFIANFSVTEEDGKEYIFEGDVIREGLEISTYDQNGDVIPLPDGEYTIKGVKVRMVDGVVNELPDKESKVEASQDTPPQDGNAEEDPQTAPNNEPKDDARVAELTAQVEALKAENEALKKEIEELKSVPMADPVPQRTNMSTEENTETPDILKGTRYKKAYDIFNNK